MTHKHKFVTGVGKAIQHKLAGSAPKKNSVNPQYTKALKGRR